MATISCPNCSALLDESKKFCTECGKKLPLMEEQQQDEIAMQETQKFTLQEDKTLEEAVKAVFQKEDDEEDDKKARKKSRKNKKKKEILDKEDKEQQTIVDFSALAGSTLDDSPYEPITAWGFIGILALFAIPVIGWIFAIVWACGGCRKLNKRNLSRGYLLILALVAVFIGCAFLAVWKIAPAYLENNEPIPVVTAPESITPLVETHFFVTGSCRLLAVPSLLSALVESTCLSGVISALGQRAIVYLLSPTNKTGAFDVEIEP